MNTHVQPDLFAPAAPAPAPYVDPSAADERAGWERRYLSDMAESPLRACPDGFAGAVLERLSARGHCTSEDAGIMPHPRTTFTGAELVKAQRYWNAHPIKQRLYTITEAGRAELLERQSQ